MNDLAHCITGSSAVKIAASVEAAARAGRVTAGQQLPTVRRLAAALGVSPATVAAAYRTLRQRGVVVGQGRRGTRLSHLPRAGRPRLAAAPTGVRDLADGNPDARLLPTMAAALRAVDPSPLLYGQAPQSADLARLVEKDLRADGIRVGPITFVSGAMDGVERVLAETLRPGDRVAIEDPGFGNVLDLVHSRGLVPVPVAVDDEGFLPDQLGRACGEGVKALVLTPRAQNPFGAALTEGRARELRAVLRRGPDVLVIEDDHANLITDVPLHSLHDGARRWVYLRSFSKALNPDLRLAAMTGDAETMTRVQDRQVVGERWVSHILQRIAYALLSDGGVRRHLRRAAATYTRRRNALRAALAAHGFPSHGESGYNVWVPVREETAAVQVLERAGWAVSTGERFRIASPPAIRVTAATLEPEEAERLAADLAAGLRGGGHTSAV